MNPLQYTSKEMFSSTELIRKSKSIFEKLQNSDIEKAIILRDGKPSFMLLDFETYENIMKEYMELKEGSSKVKTKSYEEPKKVQEVKKVEEAREIEDLDEKSLEEALNEIENLDMEQEPLKEFWE